MDDLDRMLRSLLQVMSSTYPQYLTQPFEVAEIYQNLIPYRHHRRELRIETNEDYQVALCRLLSGERGYLVADDTLADTMKSELASPNPNTAIFRDFAASRVALGPNAEKRWQELGGDASELRAAGESRGTPVPPPPPPAPPASWNDGGTRAPAATQAPRATAPSVAAASSAPRTASTASATNGNGESCRYCAGALPEGRSAKFCPHCGQNLTIQRCPACGTELEIDWKFCITCGRGVAAS